MLSAAVGWVLCPAEPVLLPPLRAGSAGALGLVALGCCWRALAVWRGRHPRFLPPAAQRGRGAAANRCVWSCSFPGVFPLFSCKQHLTELLLRNPPWLRFYLPFILNSVSPILPRKHNLTCKSFLGISVPTFPSFSLLGFGVVVSPLLILLIIFFFFALNFHVF